MALEDEKFGNSFHPDVVLHLGGPFVSKKLQQHLEIAAIRHYILVHENPKRIDPGHIVTERLQIDPTYFASELKKIVKAKKSIVKKSAIIQKLIDNILEGNELTEPGIARIISENIPADQALFIGNSMPIRDMNEFAVWDGETIIVGSNRGASGIDGAVASAAGFALGLKKPVTLLIGDVALLHDLNSLNLLRNLRFPVTIVCLNNNGGGIFSHLPIAEHKDVFETYFKTPHNLSFENAAKMFGLSWVKPHTPDVLLANLRASWSAQQSSLLEIETSERKNAELRQRLHSLLNNDETAL